MISNVYRSQVDLLLQVLPHVAKETTFALKGGTAINLFCREMPRLSVDLDLVYLPLDERESALKQIQQSLGNIRDRIKNSIRGISVTASPQVAGHEVKLNCQLRNVHVKIEVNATTRGHIFPTRLMQVTDTVQESFGKFAAINVVSSGELYGGKICAALDRQHPRDLFDVRLLLDDKDFNEDIRIGFLYFLLSHARPISEVMFPNYLDQRSAFDTQFAGMVDVPFSYDDYEEVRIKLVQQVDAMLTPDDRKFLMSFKAGDPNWSLFPIGSLEAFPSIKWKLANIRKLVATNPKKHEVQLSELGKKLGLI
ncbi:nucleotidyl transferase AbiEii/AbiGii toxin family protein [Parapedobacter tibetensis]|uniref:nucleotidyl transferase AbiEii/AbiGii toxin family protein n=1 Tax=Parapedobacter tibetensis TaxID=2972951 RepID=UPI00214DC3B9|nr:nucleotidyl transferase AbiEii/AbiGii toxin family protein [Parapedobacter tibetensis]